jgi:hypothetical protein
MRRTAARVSSLVNIFSNLDFVVKLLFGVRNKLQPRNAAFKNMDVTFGNLSNLVSQSAQIIFYAVYLCRVRLYELLPVLCLHDEL